MKIRLKVELSGTRDGVPWPPRGEAVDLPDAEAADLCAAGMADPVAERPVEKAVPPAEDVQERAEPKPEAEAKSVRSKAASRPRSPRRSG